MNPKRPQHTDQNWQPEDYLPSGREREEAEAERLWLETCLEHPEWVLLNVAAEAR